MSISSDFLWLWLRLKS